MAITPTKVERYSEDLSKAVHNFSTHVFKVLLTNSAPNAATVAVRADITELSAANGYAAGGATVTATVSRTGGTTKIVFTDPVFTASGGAIGPFQYAVLYNDTPTSPADPLIQIYNRGSAVTIPDGSTYTLDLDASLGVFTIG